MADSNKDGKVAKEEWDKHHDAMFEKMNANTDGVIDKIEIEKTKTEKKHMVIRKAIKSGFSQIHFKGFCCKNQF